MRLIRYLARLPAARIVLWCYLIWYLAIVRYHFDASPKLWINSLGISAIIGTGLLLSVSGGVRGERWQTFRLYMMPFCVSSFAALIKGQGFVLIFSPRLVENLVAGGACLAFVALVLALKRCRPAAPAQPAGGAPP